MLFFLLYRTAITKNVGVVCAPRIPMRRLRRVLATAIGVLTLLPTAGAQSTTGSILGDVSDPSGAVLPGATLRASNERTGASRETLTNEAGSFRFSGLAPDRYTVSVELSGFRSMTRPGITVPVAGEVKVDFQLEVGQVTESVTVTEVAPLVQTTQNTIRTVIDNQRVEELPLRNRDFMDLMLLAPGVTLDQSSIRRDTTDSVSFFGMGEQYKSIWLEGVDFNDEVTTGGTNISRSTRTRLGQEAIQEFQVMSSGYSAEFGRTATGAVNVVIKSGGNDLHGSGFYFLRDDSFDKPPFIVRNGVAGPVSDPPQRKKQQFGGTIGGPIAHDRAFFFGSVERQVQDTSTEVTIPDDVESFVNSLNLGYDTSRVVPQNREEINAVGKLSFNLNPSNTLNLTYLYDDNDEFNKDVNSSIAADGGFDDLSSSYFASANVTSLIGTGIVNEFRLNRSIQRLFRSAPGGSTKFLPTLVFPSVEIGTSDSVPQGRIQKNWILANTMSHQFGNHGLRWGAEMNDVEALVDSNNVFNGSYLFTCEEITCAEFGRSVRYRASFNLRFDRGETSDPTIASMSRDLDMYAFFVNDTWRVRPNFTLNMGLRYDLRVFEGDIGGPDPFEQPGFSRDHPEDVWIAVALGGTGALGVQNWRPAPNDTLDLSPRFGFSWDLTGSRRSRQLRDFPRPDQHDHAQGNRFRLQRPDHTERPGIEPGFLPDHTECRRAPCRGQRAPIGAQSDREHALHAAEQRRGSVRDHPGHGILRGFHSHSGLEVRNEPERERAASVEPDWREKGVSVRRQAQAGGRLRVSPHAPVSGPGESNPHQHPVITSGTEVFRQTRLPLGLHHR